MLPETEKALIKAVEALNPRTFPTDVGRLWKCDVQLLADRFGMSFHIVKHAYRYFRGSRGSNISPAVQRLLNYINTIACL